MSWLVAHMIDEKDAHEIFKYSYHESFVPHSGTWEDASVSVSKDWKLTSHLIFFARLQITYRWL